MGFERVHFSTGTYAVTYVYVYVFRAAARHHRVAAARIRFALWTYKGAIGRQAAGFSIWIDVNDLAAYDSAA